jgi:hypothetical protein
LEGIVDVVSSNDDSDELKKDIVYLLNPWIGYLIEGKKKAETSVKLFLIYIYNIFYLGIIDKRY